MNDKSGNGRLPELANQVLINSVTLPSLVHFTSVVNTASVKCRVLEPSLLMLLRPDRITIAIMQL